MIDLTYFLGEDELPTDGAGDEDTWNAARNALRKEIRQRFDDYINSLDSLVADFPKHEPEPRTPDDYSKHPAYRSGYEAGYQKGLRNGRREDYQ